MAEKKDNNLFLVGVGLAVLGIIITNFWKNTTLNEILYVVKIILITALIIGLLVLFLYLWWKRTINPKEEKPKKQYKKKVKVIEEPETDVEEVKEEPKKEVEKDAEKEIEQKIIQKPKFVQKEKPEKVIEKPKEIVREEVIVRTELEYINFHNASKLNDDEIDYLKRKDFKIRTYTNPFNRKKEKFIFKPSKIESDAHCIITNLTANYLKKKKVKNVKTFQTTKADITFEIKSKKYAIEVETGKIHSKSKKQLQEKVDLLNQNYDKWFFVVIKRNFVSRYRKFGIVIDARYLKNQLNKLVSK